MTFQQTLSQASSALRRGDLSEARRIVGAGLAAAPTSYELLNMAGILAAQSGDISGAVNYFQSLHHLAPDDMSARVNLATALVASGRFEDAKPFVVGYEEEQPKLRRLAAQIAQNSGDYLRAIHLFEKVVHHNPADWEAWNNLGNAYGGNRDIEAGIAAIERAIQLRPTTRELYFNLALLLAKADRPQARVAHMRAAAARFGEDPGILTELGLAEAGVDNPQAAQNAFRAAIDHDPHYAPAYIELALLLENRNQLDELNALVDRAEAAPLPSGELAFLHAWQLRRSGDLIGAMRAAEQFPETIAPLRRLQIIAELADRLGETDRAFAAFIQMNETARESRSELQGPSYREMLERDNARFTEWQNRPWTSFEPKDGWRDPAFIVGFPRSGTTLLDTMLTNAPELSVMEELPALTRVMEIPEAKINLPELAPAQIKAMRLAYFEATEELAAPRDGTRILDKHPLHLTQIPLIHRLFPEAHIIFVERHPYDAVLSCFMANFRLNFAMRSFTDLIEAALTYDSAMRSWTWSEVNLPVNTIRIRYERMVEDTESELRRAVAFLGLPWRPEFTDNRSAAARREHIRTASYAQVTESIYKRAVYRWKRYQSHLQPIRHILAPWAERMGYPT